MILSPRNSNYSRPWLIALEAGDTRRKVVCLAARTEPISRARVVLTTTASATATAIRSALTKGGREITILTLVTTANT